MWSILKKSANQPTPDEVLVRAWVDKGDSAALGQVYARYMTLIYGICLKYLKDTHASEDAVMQIFEQVQKKLAGSEVQNFKAWVCTVARNHCLMELRKVKNKQVEHLDPADSRVFELDDTDFGFADDREELLVRLEKCLELLGATQKWMVRLFYLEEMSYQQISEQTNTALGMVRSHIQNGRRNLRNCMGAPA